MIELTFIQKLTIWILPLLFAITVHEVAHGWVAYKLGDPTAKLLGRLTLNPIKHIDPIGTLVVPGILLLLGGFIFGWAKPVPVNPINLPSRSSMAWVALAGPSANFLMALGWGICAKIGLAMEPTLPMVSLFLQLMGKAGILINLVLMVLNLLPIPPLDGSRALLSITPYKIAREFEKIEPYGFFILLLLLVTGLLSTILQPIVIALHHFILTLLNF